MHDIHGEPAFFFVFPDLFVAVEGTYRLKFTLLRLSDNVDLCENECDTPEVYAFSEPFRVYATKDYPGMRGKPVAGGGGGGGGCAASEFSFLSLSLSRSFSLILPGSLSRSLSYAPWKHLSNSLPYHPPESTELTRHVAKQGIKVPLRNDARYLPKAGA